MQRRNFGARALAGGALIATLPLAAKAASGMHWQNLVFTKTDTGHWTGVEALHVPVLTLAGQTLTVRTPHPMSPAHYIVSHTVVLAGGVFLDRKTFTPADEPVSTHTLPAGYRGEVLVTSTCNLHDFWLEKLSV
jgi:superoxide reductase